LVGIALLSAVNRKWGGLDFFGFRGVVTFCGDVLGRRYWSIQDQSAATLLTGRDPSNLFLLSPEVMWKWSAIQGGRRLPTICLPTIMFLRRPAALPTPVKRGLAQQD
jgi:hypothetical protein